MFQRRTCQWLFAVALTLTISARTLAIPLDYTVDDLGSGVFQYNLTINNVFSEPLSGLNIFHGYSVFGLDNSSVISAPGGWSFFAPLPPLVDELNWFSITSASDIPIGSSLGGFSFQSTTDPATLKSGDFAFDFIGGTSGKQIPVPDSFHTSILLLGSLFILIACSRVPFKVLKNPRRPCGDAR